MAARLALFLSAGGLFLAFVGAALAARAVIITKRQAIQLSGTYWNQNKILTRALWRQSKATQRGLALIAAGTLMQMAGALISAL